MTQKEDFIFYFFSSDEGKKTLVGAKQYTECRLMVLLETTVWKPLKNPITSKKQAGELIRAGALIKMNMAPLNIETERDLSC